MKPNLFFSVLGSCMLAGQVVAGTMGSEVVNFSDWAWVGTFSAGPVWARANQLALTLNLAPGIEKTYVANKSTNMLFDGEVFLGLQKTLTQTVQLQLGPAVAFTGNTNLDGEIWDDADPEFDNYTYRYKIRHTHVAFKGKLLKDIGFWFIPWVSGSVGLGLGFNDAHDFKNFPKISEAAPTPNFKSHTQSTVTYTLGAGAQKVLNEHWQVGAAYEFANWEKSRLGRTFGQTQGSGGLSLNHLYTNGVLFNLTYLS